MALPTRSSLAICRDAVVEMLNDADREWSGEFDAVARYLWQPEPEELQELCVAVTYGKTEWTTEVRDSLKKTNYIDITFRKELEPPDNDDDDVDDVLVEMDALGALVEHVANFFKSDTEAGSGVRFLGDTQSWVSEIEIFPTWSPEELKNNRAFLSVITLWVCGVEGVRDANNE